LTPYFYELSYLIVLTTERNYKDSYNGYCVEF